MLMPPPFKPTGRNDEEQAMPQRTHSDGLITNENQSNDISIKIQTTDGNTRLGSPKARVPPALQPLKAVSATLKNAGSASGVSHPGPRSVFFTTAKIVGTASVPGQITRLNSPTTTQANFLLPQTRINEKQNISSTPPTLMFRPANHQIRPSPLTIQNQTPSALPPILQSQRSSVSGSFFPATQIVTQGSFVVSHVNPQVIPQAQKSFLSGQAASNTSVNAASLQTVSVIKQQVVSSQNLLSQNTMKSFTSITDILSSKDNKNETINTGKNFTSVLPFL